MREVSNMDKITLLQNARVHLAPILEKPGGIIYSSHETLKPADIYLLGFNPGGSDGCPIKQNISKLLTNTENSYLDQEWKNGIGEYPRGEAPLQKRVQWLLKELGQDPREVCASNLIFAQSRQASDISYGIAKTCWPVHEDILRIVKPKLIIAFGNSEVSPYRYLHTMFLGQEEVQESGHGTWKLKGFQTQINSESVYVAGLPHLSRYSPIGKHHVIEWLLEKL